MAVRTRVPLGRVDRATVARGERRLPQGRPDAVAKLRTADVARRTRHERGAVGVDRLDRQPQRHPDARVPQRARRGGGLRPRRPATAVGSRRARLPAGGRGRPARRGSPGPRGAPAARARHRQARGARCAGRASLEEVEGEPAEVEGTSGTWVVDPAAIGAGLRGSHGAALAVRPADPRPRSRAGAVRLRVLPGDVQAGRTSDAGATSRCRSSTTTGSSGSSTRLPTGRPRRCGCTRSTRTSGSRGR